MSRGGGRLPRTRAAFAGFAAFAAFITSLVPAAIADAAIRDRAVIGMQLEPPILDPSANPASAISEVLYGNVYEGLVQFAVDGSAAPLLAESWEISPDGLTYSFHLRAGVKFSDGSDFDASVAKFSLERAIAAGSTNPQKPRLAAIGTIEALDPRTLRVGL